MSEKEFSYAKALSELEEILAEIETDELDLDILSEKVKRASFLIKECKSRLRKTTDEINSILSDWEKED
ncbi:MAG: exodeoxyribonuclease VII small subunit [Bacteroidales bacterium]|jgi:exodeoxyribonuclease VII small subunit|nr:exodeoxyribonuclease VII small subunit [Bacteroidales bacterium]MCK9498593.1 exodeoxyribonuclease VII small subunit [Bacteroidales bacterium]MDY0314708.1 exodeoxyribonuclease VII small subunit [Bacteroidales bacterium]NLB85500.1 exodeoxyribonuclease VII small subunit [Bacteroidales bacterium]